MLKTSYNENYKVPKKETKEDTTRWKDLPCSCISRVNVKLAILPKMIIQFNEIPIKIP
jgi:hypothetical protein